MQPVLALRHVSRRFGGVLALDDASLEIGAGEVHGLLGENGSGKSTLIKILAGYHQPEPGAELEVGGRPVPLPLAPGQFRDLGLGFVHQDLGLIPDLTVLENLRMTSLADRGVCARIKWRRERQEALTTFERFGLELDPDVQVLRLSQVDRARLAIVRAFEDVRRQLVGHPEHRGLLVLDEPTVFLPREGVDQLFRLIRDVVAHHASVLFVSHDLDEVRTITDRVTVLRDGRTRGTIVTAQADEEALVELIIGRKLASFDGRTHAVTSDAAVEVISVRGPQTREVSFSLAVGEIVGVTGLIGSGFDELPYLLSGARAATGQLRLRGVAHRLDSLTPARALRAGIILVPGDRARYGCVLDLPVGENIMLPTLSEFERRLMLRRRALREAARAALVLYDVRPQDPDLNVAALSGGNQQKAVMAKFLRMTPSLMLLHEPTQGVDIGARQQIFALMQEEAARGACLVCASSDYEQLAAVCDRVLIFGRGRVVRELHGEHLSKERIAEQVYGSVTLAKSGATGGP